MKPEIKSEILFFNSIKNIKFSPEVIKNGVLSESDYDKYSDHLQNLRCEFQNEVINNMMILNFESREFYLKRIDNRVQNALKEIIIYDLSGTSLTYLEGARLTVDENEIKFYSDDTLKEVLCTWRFETFNNLSKIEKEALEECDKWLKLNIPSTEANDNHNESSIHKFKWKGTPAQLAFIMSLLQDKGYIDGLTASGERNAKIILTHFEIENHKSTPDSLGQCFQKLKRDELPINPDDAAKFLKIPHRKDLKR